MGFFGTLGSGRTRARNAVSRGAAIDLASGHAFALQAVGLRQRQGEIDAICGGKHEKGHVLEVTAELRPQDRDPTNEDAIEVLIDGRLVGFVPQDQAKSLRSEMQDVNPSGGRMFCRAKIVGGRLGRGGAEGSYQVALNVSRPLRCREARRFNRRYG